MTHVAADGRQRMVPASRGASPGLIDEFEALSRALDGGRRGRGSWTGSNRARKQAGLA